jgi:hypothetical protein
MRDHQKPDPQAYDPKVPHNKVWPVPAMPVNLPVGDALHPHTSPLRHDENTEEPDPALPPEPGNDINP